jgi:hypothetical protein
MKQKNGERNFRILFEEKNFIGWRVIENCKTKRDAVELFTQAFPNFKIIQVVEVLKTTD